MSESTPMTELSRLLELCETLGIPPMADLSANPTTPKSGQSVKIQQEKKRRDHNNHLIDVLKELVQDPSHGNLSIRAVLEKTYQTITKLHRESTSDPQLAGFFQGLAKAESIVIKYIESLELSPPSCKEYIKGIKEVFAREHAEKGKTKLGAVGISPKSTTEKRDQTDQMDRKEVKKNREQERRDKHSEGYAALIDFIYKLGLVTPKRGKLHRIDALETIIKYIQETRATVSDQSTQNQLQRTIGDMEGQQRGKAISIHFFQCNAHLVVYALALNTFFNFNMNPQPLMGFPAAKIPSPLPAAPVAVSEADPTDPPAPVAFDPTMVMKLFQLLFANSTQSTIPPIPGSCKASMSPTGSTTSSESSSSSGSSSPSRNNSSEHSSPKLTASKSAKKIFRPYCL